MNKTLILTATHGDEDFSLSVVRNLRQKYVFDWLVSNPRALALRQRFTDSDLNRSGPGNRTSSQYEVRRARQIISKATQYDRVIDIHGTTANSGIFIILSDPNWQNIEFAKTINLSRVVLWPSLKPQGPLTQFIPYSLEIECGPKNSPQIVTQLKTVLSDYLSGKPRQKPQSYYIVTGSLPQPIGQSMKDFVATNFQGKSFTPLLVDQYPGIKCYCLQQLDQPLDFNTTNTPSQ